MCACDVVTHARNSGKATFLGGGKKGVVGISYERVSWGRQRVHFSFIVSICNVGNYWHIVHWEYEKKKNYFEA